MSAIAFLSGAIVVNAGIANDRSLPRMPVVRGSRHHRTGLALEPMTCPPDAFNSGEGVVGLERGRPVTTKWRIGAVM